MKKKIINILILIFLVGCGYTPIFQTKDLNYSIKNLELEGENNLNYKINNNLKKYINTKNKTKFYEIKALTEKRKTIISKDTKGDAKLFQLEIYVKFYVFENDSLIQEKIFIENFQYNNNTKKFELSQYEKNIADNLINKILEKINIFLYSI